MVEKRVSSDKSNRFMELEGLRVVAAAVVVFFHAGLIFYPGYFYGIGSQLAPVQNMRFEDNLYQNPFAGLLSGTFGVGIFFVLSGFVLSVNFFRKKDSSILKKYAAKRYLRLMLPAFVSIVIALIIIALGWSRAMSEVATVTHTTWLDHFWKAPPDILDMLYKGVIGIFSSPVTHVYNPTSYNPALWTIHYEFIGSLIVFGSLFLFMQSRYRWIVYGVLIFYFLNSWLLGFILGMLLADIYVNKRIIYEKLDNKLTYVMLVMGVIFGSFPSGEVTSSFYKALELPFFNNLQQISFYITLGACLCIISVLSIEKIRNFFAHPKLSYFGKYTYSAYLLHLPVLFTVCTSVFLLTLPVGFNKAAVISTFASIIVLLPATYLFEKFIDSPSIKIANYCTDVYLDGRRIDFKKFRLALQRVAFKLRPSKRDRTPEAEVE